VATGKTLLAKTLARLVDVPLVIADATCLTQVISHGRSYRGDLKWKNLQG
jgi:ATP-dependent protease Clp ATPase subunit